MLEDGIRALVYAGDLDFICNWIGNKAWTKDLDWSGKSAYSAAKDQDWKFALDGASAKKGGMVRTASAAKGSGSLTFLQVYEGGHMVPMDQPEAALSLLNTFTANKPFA
jgi:cathepsin A (carboxypeptidase C)